MNNRIYVLAKEAGLIEFEQLDWNPDLKSPTYESVAKARKFAELIVQECIYTIQRQMVRNGNNTPENIRSRQHINDLGAKFGITFPMDYFGSNDE